MTLIDAILKEIRTRRAQLADGLANSSAKNFEEYRFICGELRGLAAVEMYLIDLAKNLEHNDDE
jgi:hypothetical protein